MPERDGSEVVAGSFRDPSGFIFVRDGVVHRQVNLAYRQQYDRLTGAAGQGPSLYRRLVDAGFLVPHEEVDVPPPVPETAYRVIRPEQIPFVTYPYEWCFSQLKDAALLTLAVQRQAMECGMSLKDASAYNVQLAAGRPVLIDTLSFEGYQEGEPWVAYRQFCQHFLAPLALMSHRDVRLGQLLRVYIDGVPLDLASSLLPTKTRMSLALGTHIHLHARSQRRHADRATRPRRGAVSRTALLGIIASLESGVRGLTWKPEGTEWADYYAETNYDEAAFEHKQRTVGAYLERVRPGLVWDLGANTGVFSRIAAERGALVVSADIDPAAVERSYLDCRARAEKLMLPVVLDLTNPSPAVGWANSERTSFLDRGPADAVLALALVHHLAIGNNVPLPRIAGFFARIGRHLIVEFVPKSDSQVQRMLATREDIFPLYGREGFERAFAVDFETVDSTQLPGSERRVYLMARRKDRP